MRVPAKLWILFIVFVGGIASSPLRAEPFPISDVPPQLRPWVPWVLDSARERNCAVVDGESVCYWPGEISLQLDGEGGSFEMPVLADKSLDVALPGGGKTWPQEVRVDGRRAVVIGEEQPRIRVESGRYRITGRFFFDELPRELKLPRSIALVSLRVDGEEIPFPRRDEDGTLRLQSASVNIEQDERLDLTVVRKVSDGIPLWVETRLTLRVSGKSREVILKDALVPGTTPLSVDSQIPARLSENGALILQVRAGTHTVSIHARAPKMDTIRSMAREAPWPEREFWVWAPDERIRQAGISGPPPVDPSRTPLPSEWQGYSAFAVDLGSELKITTKRRGQPEPPPDQLTLRREMWMELEGNGFTIQDSLEGTLSRAWRLDLEAKGNLGHVSVDGTDQLITQNPKTARSGVELRSKSLQMLAEWRSDGATKDLPAVGWSKDVQQLGARVHLPPGWTVLFAKGVDDLPGTWWDQWDLWGFFFVLIISFAVGKLTRPVFGGLAFLALVLSYHETNAPSAVWVSLLASLGLLKVLPPGKLRFVGRMWSWVSIIWLAAVLIPFSVQQVRTGLFPQIEDGDDWHFTRMESAADGWRGPPKSDISYADQVEQLEKSVAEDEPPPVPEGAISMGAGGAPQEIMRAEPKKKTRGRRPRASRNTQEAEGALSSSIAAQMDPLGNMDLYDKKERKPKQSMQQDPNAVVQTGPGVPNWKWTAMDLSWSGPVAKDHRFRLIMMSPTVHLMVSMIRVLLLVLIGLRVGHEIFRILRSPSRGVGGAGSGNPGGAKAATIGIVLAGLMVGPRIGRAEEVPNESTLSQLRDKLTRGPQCRPDCVSASRLAVSVRDQRVSFRAEVHAGDTSSWPIPGPAKNWVPTEVRVDGRRTSALVVRSDGFIHVRLEPGYHEVVVEGPVPLGNTFTIEFGLVPHNVRADAPGFVVEGISPGGTSEGSIQLSKSANEKDDPSGQASFEEGSYPPWLEITRTFDFGIPWLLHTHVRRVSPVGTPIMTRVPLIAGESVTESEVQVEQGAVVLAMSRDQTDLRWSSTLAERSEMKLTAEVNTPWTERWVLKCSPVWQCAHKGLPPIDGHGGARYEPTFWPWPGESLALNLTKPGGVSGQSITVDAARLTLSPGIRLVKAELGLWIRSSQGGLQNITLPKGAQVQTLTVDGKKRTFRVEGDKTGGGRLEVNLKPGSSKIDVVWQQPGGIRNLYRVQKVRLGRLCANVTVTVNLPGDRWLLLAGGPDWGPAVLFWGFLMTILLGGLILGRIKISPLKSWQWMLLALGLTQVPVGVTLTIVGWFLILAWRAKEPPKNTFVHNALQIGLGIWTVAALGCLVGVVYNGLAVRPDMQVTGAGSTNTSLVWYVDRIQDAIPTPWVASVPILVWKLIMLAWALWLAGSIIKWAPWAWRAFSAETLWRKRAKKIKKAVAKKDGESK